MGIIKRRSKEELAEMNRVRRNRYYDKHKEEESAKNLARYYEDKKLSNGDMPYSSSYCDTRTVNGELTSSIISEILFNVSGN